MYKIPIIIAASAFVTATVVEFLALEIPGGSLAGWLAHPHRISLLAVIIAMNAIQGALFGYAAHRAARNAFLWQRSEREHRTLTYRLRSELQPALTVVQYAAYKTYDKQCIKICNEAITRVVRAVTAVEVGSE